MSFKKIISSILSCILIILVGTCISVNATDKKIIDAKYDLITEVFDYGQQVNKVVIDLKTTIKGSTVNKNTFSVIAKNEVNGQKLDMATRLVTNVYISDSPLGDPSDYGEYIVLELEYGINVSDAYTLFWDFRSFSNYPIDLKYDVVQMFPIEDIEGNIVNNDNLKLSMNNVSNLLVDDFKKATSKTGLSYRHFEPAKDDKKNPLIIWLHGVGEGGVNNSSQISANRGGVAFITEDIQEKFGGAYVMAPQSPSYWMPSFTLGNLTINGDKDYTQDIIDLVTEYIRNNPDVDPTRVYIGGCSMGGYQTLKAIIAAPDLFAAAFPTCAAYSPTNEELKKIGNLPVWFTHAKSDTTVPYTNSKDAYEYLKQFSDNAHYTEYETVNFNGIEHSGHSSWVYVLNNDPKNEDGEHIIDWISRQVNVYGHRWQN